MIKIELGRVLTEEEMRKVKEDYEGYLTKITPKHSVCKNMAKAFATGGAICLLGQIIMNLAGDFGCSKEDAACVTSLILILLSVLLTGCNIYPVLAKFGGAGTLVPITGFANSVAAPAIESQSEGQVFGIGCQIFTIAGPVILYGILCSWGLGLLYWGLKMFGWI